MFDVSLVSNIYSGLFFFFFFFFGGWPPPLVIVAFLWRTGLVGAYCISGEEGEKARICGCSPQQHIS